MTIQRRNAEMVNLLRTDFVHHKYYEISSMRPVYNVQAIAEADGVTDDYQAFADIDDAALADGGLAYAPPGNYEIASSITLDANWFTAPGVTFTNVTPTFVARYELGLGAGGAVDHGSLAGLGDDDHTQYLLADGSRDLTGNLTVSAGITIDGVDIGAHAANADIHADHTSISIIAGDGLTGGGDLTASRTINLATPGTLHVSSTNNAAFHTHTITTSSNPGAAASILATDASGLLQLRGLGLGAASTAGTLRIRATNNLLEVGYDASNYLIITTQSDGDAVFQPTGDIYLAPTGGQVALSGQLSVGSGALPTSGIDLHVITDAPSNTQLRLAYDGSNYADLDTGSGGVLNITPSGGGIYASSYLTLATTYQPQLTLTHTLFTAEAYFSVNSSGNLTVFTNGDFIFNASGDDILPNTNYDLNIGAIHKKYLRLYASELWVETLVAQETIATIGGRILVGPTTSLTRDITDSATTIYVKHNQMSNGDIVYLEAYNPSAQDGGPTSRVEFMQVTSSATTIDGTPPDTEYSYTVTRNYGTTPGADYWYAGDAVFNTGTTDDGFIDLYSLSGVDSNGVGPTIVGNVRNSTTYNDWSEHWAIGNLNGLYGQGASDIYGVGLGEYATDTDYIVITNASGIEFYSDNVLHAQLTSSAWTLGDTGNEHVEITSTAVNINDGATTYTSVSGGVVSVGDTGNEHVLINTSGVSLKDGASVYGVFAATTTIGATGSHHVSISSSGIDLKDSSTVKIRAQTDGDIFIGSDISSAGSTYFSIFATAQTYNSESVAAGDMLIGDNSASKANIYWDYSAGELLFRSGQSSNIKLDTNGSLTISLGDAVEHLRWRDSGVTYARLWSNFSSPDSAFSIDTLASGAASSAVITGYVDQTADEAWHHIGQAGNLGTYNGLVVGSDQASGPTPAAMLDVRGGIEYTGDLTKDIGATDHTGYIYVPLATAASRTGYTGQTVSSTQTDLDPSDWDGNIPSDAVAIMARLAIADSNVGVVARMTPDNSTDPANSLAVYTQVANQLNDNQGVVLLDGGLFDLYVSESIDDVYLYILGYFI